MHVKKLFNNYNTIMFDKPMVYDKFKFSRCFVQQSIKSTPTLY